MKDFSYLNNANPDFIDSLYQTYLNNPEALDPSWKAFFKGFDFAKQHNPDGETQQNLNQFEKELKVYQLIQDFRSRGHLLSDTNPIRKRKDRNAQLDLEDFGLSPDDLNLRFEAGKHLNLPNASLSEILEQLKSIYCSKIGYEFTYIESNERRNWFQQKIEERIPVVDFNLNLTTKKRILEKINGAVIFEKFLHTKYVGQKRFSLEGGECTIPALDCIIETSASLGVEELIIGMAHRGRLNVLANIIGKTYEQIFNEFEGNAIPDISFGSGDVKYHLGFSSQIQTDSGKMVQLKLAPNPSHLEAVDPVACGLSRAKADILYHSDYDKILPILIHGDSAIAGQGIVYETIQMSQLPGYYTGGTIHFIINNQIGFTTDFDDARSSTYSSSVASVIQAPVIHVNGDDPEAVYYAAKLATEYRQQFNSDIFIDMVCYRRHGHNEGDDPKFTQPGMYEIISKHPNVRELYIKELESRGDLQAQLAQDMEKTFWNLLQERLDQVKQNPLPYTYQEPELAWRSLKNKIEAKDFDKNPDTGISMEQIKSLLNSILEIPKDFNPLPKIKRLFQNWEQLISTNKTDWALAELLAYASLLVEGKNVRLSGQDVKRGTFSHRHAILFDAITNEDYNRLSKLSDQQAHFFIYNSLLSEFGVLGFEYGYSLASPNQLVIWEAQFGDFANGAQVITDQFITTAQSKWNRMSGLVLLLPHGYDGQGPEHSSARLERFLQNCAEQNVVVVNVSTPANFFHLLRRQLLWNFRIPLIVMSPKSLFRHPECHSQLEEFKTGSTFKEILVDKISSEVNSILLCSGQIYYDLKAKREELKLEDCMIVRIEQLYPFPQAQVDKILNKYKTARLSWVQEEPANMGTASYIQAKLNKNKLEMICRPASASSAVGFKKIHDAQLKEILQAAFN